MKNKPLLFWGLGAGVIALVVFIVGYAFVWPVNDDGHKSGRMKDGKCGRISGGMEGMMGEDGGCGMMGDMMSGGMGGMMGSGMMGSPVDAATAPISIDQAADAARRYVSDQGNADLKVTRILEFTNGFYARVNEQSTGTGAYELKIDRNSGNVSRTMGPGMIWNKKYKSGMEGMDHGNMSGGNGMEGMDHGNNSTGTTGSMMGRDHTNASTGSTTGATTVDDKATTTDMTIKAEDARNRAQKYADVQFPGSKAGNPAMFYGYYTFDIEKDGRVLAMLSVNGYSGQVWLHTLNGTYLGGKTL